MKFQCGKWKAERRARREEKRHQQRQWHKFFAILPVKVGEFDCRFLETVERRLLFYSVIDFGGFTVAEYRAVEK